MPIFKNYDGKPIDILSHTHKVSDTQAIRPMITVGTTELFSTNTAILTYYSTTLTPIINNETVGDRVIMIFSTSSTDLNGNLVLKMSTNVPLVNTKEYILVLEPIEDNNTKTNIISFEFGSTKPYNFKNSTYISEDIVRPVINYGNKISYMYKIRPKTDINSIIVQLYTISKFSGINTKKLFKISIREVAYQDTLSTAIVTTSDIGFMSVEDKHKIENISNYANYIESKLMNAVFYKKPKAIKIIPTMMNGDAFNTKLASVRSKITTIEFTQNIPNLGNYILNTDKWDISEKQNGSIYAWINGTKLSISGNGTILANQDCSYMFYKFYELISLNFNNLFDTSKSTNFRSFLQLCRVLPSIDLSNLDMNNATSMDYMCYDTLKLKSINFGKNNTASKVLSFDHMFANSGIERLDLSSFTTNEAQNFSSMFLNCTSLIELDISNFNTLKATNMYSMFDTVSVLNYINLSHFDATNVTNMDYMFNGSNNLKTIETPKNIKTPSMTTITTKTFYDKSDNFNQYDAGTFPKNIITSHTLTDERPKIPLTGKVDIRYEADRSITATLERVPIDAQIKYDWYTLNTSSRILYSGNYDMATSNTLVSEINTLTFGGYITANVSSPNFRYGATLSIYKDNTEVFNKNFLEVSNFTIELDPKAKYRLELTPDIISNFYEINYMEYEGTFNSTTSDNKYYPINYSDKICCIIYDTSEKYSGNLRSNILG